MSSGTTTSSFRQAATRFLRAPILGEVDWQDFRRQEVVLVTLYILLLVVAAVLPFGFGQPLGLPPHGVIALLGIRFVEQCSVLLWFALRTKQPGPRFISVYPRLSVLAHLVFATAIVGLSHGLDSHVAVLLVLPLVAAAFRLSVPGLALAYVASAALCIVEVRLAYPESSQTATEEYYHAVVVAMVFAILALVVRLLSGSLRENERRLRESLEDLQHARERLTAEEALAAVGRLSSAIAHEIRNPVAMIASSANMARRDRTSPEARREVLEIIEKESARLEKLTQDFLNYAKPKPPDRKPTSIADSVDYVAGLARARIESAGITLQTECDAQTRFDIDAYQIHQALLNLVINALDATPSGGTVKVGARKGRSGNLVLWVENTGDPIPSDAASSKIFEPFYTSKKGGTGLGLAIARNIARAHGGTLWLSANKPDCIRFEMAIPPLNTTTGENLGSSLDR